MEPRQYRYPGPKAFTEDQSQLFYGREKEIGYLANLIDLKKTVVLFGKSGIGKSSLLNAGVMPILRQKQNYEARVIRLLFKGDFSLPPEDDSNYLVNNVMQNFPLPPASHFLQKIPYKASTLWWHFKQLQILDKNSKVYLLIFDQFEELGSYQQNMVSQFLKQLNELLNFTMSPAFKMVFQESFDKNNQLLSDEEMDLLYEPVEVKLVMIVKSEKMGLLHAIRNYISDILQNCHELNPLSIEQARIAIQKPAMEEIPGATPFFRFEQEAVRAIVDFLREKSDTSFYESPGIQTSLLQMICSQIEQVIVNDQENKIVTREELDDINDLTEDYYNSRLNMLVNLFNLDEAKDKLVRKFLEDKLITQQGETLFREQVFEDNFPVEYGPLKEEGARILYQLVDFGILRKDKRMSERGVRYFYEISHEKLLEPILNNRNKLLQNSQKDANIHGEQKPGIINRKSRALGVSESSITPDNNMKSNDAYAFIRKANELCYAGEYRKSIEYFNRALEIDPAYFHTYYLRGSAYYNDKNYEAAILDFNKTLELNPEYYDSYNERGRCNLQLKNYELAKEDFMKVLEKDPKAHYAYNNLGLTYLNQGKYEDSIVEFDKSLELQIDFGSSWQNKGIALGLLGRYDEAIELFNKLEQLEPGTYGPFYSRGICYFELGNKKETKEEANKYFEKSIIELSQSILLNPGDSLAKYYLAMGYEKSDDLSSAHKHYSELVKSFPIYTDAWYRKGLCEFKLKQHQLALSSYSKVLELDPNHTESFFEKGRTFYELGNDADSIREFTEVINRTNEYKEAYYNRGLSYYNLKKYPEAIEDFGNSIRFDPAYYLAYFKRGQSKYALMLYKEAIEDFNVIAQQDPVYPRLNVYMGASYSGLGDYATGLDYHLKEYTIDPQNLWNLQNLGFSYHKINPPDFKKSLEFHLKAHEIDPRDAWNLSNIGYCYQNIDPPDYEQALEFHLKTYELNPGDVWNLSNIGVCYDRMAVPDHQKALEFSQKAYDLNKDDTMIELNLGWCLLLTGDLETAKLHLENTVRRDENEIEAFMNLGHIALLQNDREKALGYYTRRLKAAENVDFFRKIYMADFVSLQPLGMTKETYEGMLEEVIGVNREM